MSETQTPTNGAQSRVALGTEALPHAGDHEPNGRHPDAVGTTQEDLRASIVREVHPEVRTALYNVLGDICYLLQRVREERQERSALAERLADTRIRLGHVEQALKPGPSPFQDDGSNRIDEIEFRLREVERAVAGGQEWQRGIERDLCYVQGAIDFLSGLRRVA